MRRQKRDFIGLVVVALGATVSWGCPRPAAISPQLPQAPVPATPSDAALAAPRRLADGGTTYDLDRDGQPDLWVHLASGPDGGAHRVVRKELDMNGDGRPDLHKEYGPDGLLLREWFDADFDGKPDSVSIYDGGLLLESSRDEDSDGRLETRVYFLDEVISRIEADRDGDGQVDYRELWDGGVLESRWGDLGGDGGLIRLPSGGWLVFPDGGY